MGGGPKVDDDAMTEAMTKLSPLAKHLGFGGMCGLTSGFAAKKLGKFGAFIIGCSFMCLQGLAYAGIIEVKWAAIEKKLQDKADVNHDGQVDIKDMVSVWKKYIKPILTFHLPHATGFSVGFLTGVRYG